MKDEILFMSDKKPHTLIVENITKVERSGNKIITTGVHGENDKVFLEYETEEEAVKDYKRLIDMLIKE